MMKNILLIIIAVIFVSFSQCDGLRIIDIEPQIQCDSIVLIGEEYATINHVQLLEKNDSVFIFVDYGGLPTIEKYFYCITEGKLLHLESINLLKHFQIKTSGPRLFGISEQSLTDSSVFMPPVRFCVHNDNIYFVQRNHFWDFRISSLHIPSDSLTIMYENIFNDVNVVPKSETYPPLFISDSIFVLYVVNYEKSDYKKKHEFDLELIATFNIHSGKFEMLPVRYPKEFEKNYHLSGSREIMPVVKGDSMIISFSMCDEIIIYDFQTKKVKSVIAGSRLNPGYTYISPHQPFEKIEKINFHMFRYYYLIYDKAHNVFLRFYLNESKENIETFQPKNRWKKELGVAVFSHDFSYIGDYVFGEIKDFSMFRTEYLYCPHVSAKKGIFIVPMVKDILKITKLNYKIALSREKFSSL